jgi:hypothetical protein
MISQSLCALASDWLIGMARALGMRFARMGMAVEAQRPSALLIGAGSAFPQINRTAVPAGFKSGSWIEWPIPPVNMVHFG